MHSQIEWIMNHWGNNWWKCPWDICSGDGLAKRETFDFCPPTAAQTHRIMLFAARHPRGNHLANNNNNNNNRAMPVSIPIPIVSNVRMNVSVSLSYIIDIINSNSLDVVEWEWGMSQILDDAHWRPVVAIIQALSIIDLTYRLAPM